MVKFEAFGEFERHNHDSACGQRGVVVDEGDRFVSEQRGNAAGSCSVVCDDGCKSAAFALDILARLRDDACELGFIRFSVGALQQIGGYVVALDGGRHAYGRRGA